MNAWIPPTEEGGDWTAEAGDSLGSLARDAGISQSEAEGVMRGYNSENGNNRSSDIMVYVGDKVSIPGKSSEKSNNDNEYIWNSGVNTSELNTGSKNSTVESDNTNPYIQYQKGGHTVYGDMDGGKTIGSGYKATEHDYGSWDASRKIKEIWKYRNVDDTMETLRLRWPGRKPDTILLKEPIIIDKTKGAT